MMKASDLVIVGFNTQIAALDKFNGEVLWKWKAPHGMGYVAVVLDGERLYASVQGYTYCIDAITGQTRWVNKLEGMGTGVPCVALAGGVSLPSYIEQDAEDQRQQQSNQANRRYGKS